MRLSEHQVENIRKRIEESGIRLESLQDDVLDHLCCMLECNKYQTEDFETVLQQAIRELAPDGLDNLQRETVYLLNHKKLLQMKKLMHVVGLGSSMSLAMGMCFKILQWRGADELLIYGFLTFTLLFLPMSVVDRFKLTIQKSLSEKLRFTLGALSAVLAGLSVLFKILHLYGADLMLLSAAVLFSFGFLPFLFFTNYRKAVEQHL